MERSKLEELYDRDFKRTEKWMPFDERIKRPDYKDTFMLKFVKQGGDLLDCGCGNGDFLYLANLLKKVKATGIDVSPEAVKKAQENVGQSAKISTGIVEEIPHPDSTFDTVVCSQVLEHVEDPVKALQEMNRVLKKMGNLIVSVPIGRNLLDRMHINFFTFYDVMELFDKLGSDYRIYSVYKMWEKQTPDVFVIVMRKGTRLDENDNVREDDG